jgi:hypothetical protein
MRSSSISPACGRRRLQRVDDRLKRRIVGDAQASALEVTRLFSRRGFVLVDREPAGNGVALVYGGEESGGIGGWRVGSRFYVRVEPWDAHRSSVMMFGRRTMNGEEICNGIDIGRPCRSFKNHYDDATHEAQAIRGVIAELALEGRLAGEVSVTVAFRVVADRHG